MPGSWIGYPYYGTSEFYEELARVAERGIMDMLFFGDTGGTSEDYGGNHDAVVRYGAKWPRHDMTPMIPLMAKAAPGVGFALTLSTTYHHPFHCARLFNALDHVTRGRIAWNAVTSAYKNEAANYGFDEMMDHDERYVRAQEFLEVAFKRARSRARHLCRSGEGSSDRSSRPLFQRPRAAAGAAVAAAPAGGDSGGPVRTGDEACRRFCGVAVQHAANNCEHEAAPPGTRRCARRGRARAARYRHSLVDPCPGGGFGRRCRREGAALSGRHSAGSRARRDVRPIRGRLCNRQARHAARRLRRPGARAKGQPRQFRRAVENDRSQSVRARIRAVLSGRSHIGRRGHA